jgi:DNA-binding MarR family transcriptional regulator
MVDELTGLLDDVRLLFHRAVQVAEHLHQDEPVTAGGRAVLEALQCGGPMSVSEIARRRYVTRQHIQTLVNGLLADGLVTTSDNPAHRRSPLISVTPAGVTLIRRMTDREQQFLGGLQFAVDRQEIERARRTLAAVRDTIGAAHDRSS